MMSWRSNHTFLAFILFSVTVFYGCAIGQTNAWVDDKASFAKYRVFEVQPVFNATGGALPDSIPATLRSLIKEGLNDKAFQIVDSTKDKKGVLIVTSIIVVYEGCSINNIGTNTTGLSTSGAVSSGTTMAKSTCLLRTQLVDKSINRVVAEIYTTKVVGGCFTDQFKTQWLLKEVATDVVQKVGQILVSEGPV